MNFKELTIGEIMENEELRMQAQEQLKEQLKAPENREQVQSFGEMIIDILNVISKAGNKIIDDREEINTTLSSLEKLLSLSDAELRAFIDEQFKNGTITEAEREKIMNQTYRIPSVLNLLNAKATNLMFSNGVDLSETVGIDVGKKKGEHIVDLSIPTEYGELPEGLLSNLDELVHMAVCTLFENGHTSFTSKQISTLINGKEAKSKTTMEKVEASLKKLTSTWFTLDWTQHARMNGIADKDFTMKWEGTILSLERCEISLYGQHVSGYRLNRQPVLYEYNKAVNQIVPLKRKYVDIKTVSITDDARAMIYYMAKQIEIMKHPHNNMRHSMLFETIFERCGISGNAKQIQRKRDIAFKILDEWVEMEFIRAYKKKMKGRSCLGVDITV